MCASANNSICSNIFMKLANGQCCLLGSFVMQNLKWRESLLWFEYPNKRLLGNYENKEIKFLYRQTTLWMLYSVVWNVFYDIKNICKY